MADDLEKIKVEDNKKTAIRTSVKSANTAHVSPTLDLRGERYEEALVKVDRYLDAAVEMVIKLLKIVTEEEVSH